MHALAGTTLLAHATWCQCSSLTLLAGTGAWPCKRSVWTRLIVRDMMHGYPACDPKPGAAHLNGSVREKCDIGDVVGSKRGCDAAHYQRRSRRSPVADLLAMRRKLLHGKWSAWLEQPPDVHLL